MRRSVYIDTTIPSYYVDERPILRLHIDRTRQWWDEERHLYDLYTSEFTLAELAEGDFPRKEQAIQLVRDLPRLAPVEELRRSSRCMWLIIWFRLLIYETDFIWRLPASTKWTIF